jgi:hypothetical protein
MIGMIYSSGIYMINMCPVMHGFEELYEPSHTLS